MEDIKFMEDTLKTRKLYQDILKIIKTQKDENQIISWHIENDILYNQKDYFHKPEILYQNIAYIEWLKELVNNIKSIDAKRPVVVDIEVNKETVHNLEKIRDQINNIDVFGLVIKDYEYFDIVREFLNANKINYIISSLATDNLDNYKTLKDNASIFIASWQDKHEINKVSFDGLIDRKGRLKEVYNNIFSYNNSEKTIFDIPEINILKPANLIYDGQSYTYSAMIYSNGKGWEYGFEKEELNFEWTLIKCDKYGNEIALKELAKSPKLTLNMPKNHDRYKLQLSVSKENQVRQVRVNLHTPEMNVEISEIIK